MDLIEGLIKCKIPQACVSELAQKMELYINEIILFNSAYNLTNTSNHDELAVRHIFDSLAAYEIINYYSAKKDSFLVGDIGSGGGLPGIPLAAAMPKVQFNLVERMTKRCAFLENCVAILGLKNVKVICSEAEKVPPQSFDLITFRAFRPLDEKMTKTLLAMVKKGGLLCAYKAKLENIKEEMNGIKQLIDETEYEIKKLEVPYLEDSERNLVVIKNGI